MRSGLIAALVEDRRRSCPCGGITSHPYRLCRNCLALMIWGNVRRAFRSITKAAGIGEDLTPRELRHTFVSIMSDNDVPMEKIADLVGHGRQSSLRPSTGTISGPSSRPAPPPWIRS